MSVVLQFRPIHANSTYLGILIGGRADIDVRNPVEVLVRAPANQNALKRDWLL